MICLGTICDVSLRSILKTVSKNKMEMWRIGIQEQSETESTSWAGKRWLRNAARLCALTYLSAKEIQNTLVQIQKFYAQLVTRKLQRTWSFGTILSLELEVCLACHHENPACWLICLSRPLWCTLVLLLVCLAADCVLLLISSEKWPGSATVQRTVEPEIQNRVSVGFRKCWRKLYQKHGPNHCQISANVLVELEKNIISLPSLFFETEEIAVEIMLSCLDKMNWQVLASPISCVVHQVAVTLHALTSYPKELTVIAVIFCVGS